jgi:nicotinamidase/pyrazinamidase
LIVVDVQRDFCPGGALPVKSGDSIIEPTNRLISLFEKEGLPIYFTRDWHPPNHISFRPKGRWPPHCIRNTPGAEFHPSLYIPKTGTVISKGTETNIEAYSGFEGTDLARRLKQENVNELYVVGLATDYCVKNTVLDGISNGFKVDIIGDCVKGVNVKPLDSANAFRTLLAKGVRKRISRDILKKNAIR